MSFNSSNFQCLPSSLSPSLMSIVYHLHKCFSSQVGAPIATALAMASILSLLPLSILILYLGLQRWWKQPSGMMLSHFDLFTYHVAVIELMGVIGFALLCCGVHTGLPQMMMVGIYLFIFNFNGQMIFHLLTCVEHYLAVVHPIIYLSLRKANVIRKRNIVIGCVWLLSVAMTSLTFLEQKDPVIIFYFCVLSITLTVVSFLSLSVLSVLIHLGARGRG